MMSRINWISYLKILYD